MLGLWNQREAKRNSSFGGKDEMIWVIRCENCGKKGLEKDFKTEWRNVPTMWNEELGVIKSASRKFFTCLECGHIQGHPDPQSLVKQC